MLGNYFHGCSQPWPHLLLFPSGTDQLKRGSLESDAMEIRGRVHNGVVVLEGEPNLPEGATVSVLYPVAPLAVPPDSGERVQFPLVRSDRPGTLHLTSDRIAELWEDDDVSS
jgi:hypothetical protein